jgi:hypothetical protein
MLFVFRKLPDYEEFHNLTWMCCDLAWNMRSEGFWWPSAVFSALIALDIQFLSATSRIRDHILDSAHYFFQILWFSSNCIWYYGDFYLVSKELKAESNQTATAAIIPLFSPTLPTDYRFSASVVSMITISFALAFHTYWMVSTWHRSRLLVGDELRKG